MTEDRERIVRLETRTREAEITIQQLRAYIDLLKKKAGCPVLEKFTDEASQLEQENALLKAEVTQLKRQLVDQEIRNGGNPPCSQPVTHNSVISKPLDPLQATVMEDKKTNKKSKPLKRENEGPRPVVPKAPIDVSRLDFRIGKVVRARKHPDADTLYIEEVDVGEPKLRTVCSSLVNTVPLSQVQDRVAMFLCNLKPVKMCGVVSEAMIMCACFSPEKEEILDPPPGCQPGDRVYFKGYEGTPDAMLNPKKKIFETVQPDLSTNEEGVACYKDIPFRVEGKAGVFRAATLTNTSIK